MNLTIYWRRIFDTQWHLLLLGLISLSALILRIWGIGFGLPYVYHVDEHYYINTALKLGAGVINNPPYAPAGLSNLLLIEYVTYYVVGNLTGAFASLQEFESAFRSDPSIFYLLGRATSALLGTATGLGLYIIGKSLLNHTAGLIAAGFLAVSFLHVRESHYAVPDAALTFFITLSIALSIVGMRSNNRRYVYLAALTGGVAVAMKWTAPPVALAVGWASLWVGVETSKSIIGRLLKWTTVFTILLFALGFAFGSPQVVINPIPYINEGLELAGAGRKGGFERWQIDTLPGWLFYGKTLLYGVGLILLILGFSGILRRLILIVKTGDKVSIMLLLFPMTYYLLMGSTSNYFARYSLPLVPFIALFAAETVIVVAIWAATRRWRRLGWAVVVILLIGAVVQPLVRSIRHDVLLTRQDTRTLAKEWIENHIPAGAKVAVEWPTFGPPLSTPEGLIPYSHKVYLVDVIDGTGLSRHPLIWYREQGFDYLISSSFIYNIPLSYEEWDVERQKFYTSLDQELRLVQEFRPSKEEIEPPFIFDEIYGPIISLWQRERPGPVIRIYKLD